MFHNVHCASQQRVIPSILVVLPHCLLTVFLGVGFSQSISKDFFVLVTVIVLLLLLYLLLLLLLLLLTVIITLWQGWPSSFDSRSHFSKFEIFREPQLHTYLKGIQKKILKNCRKYVY